MEESTCVGSWKDKLMEGSKLGDLSLVQQALKIGATLEAVPLYEKNTALYVASINNNFEVLKYLIEKAGAQIDCCRQYCTPLYLFTRHRNLTAVKYLLQNGANVNYGNSAIAAATINRDMTMMKLLMQKKPMLISCFTRSTLSTATEGGNIKVVQYLVENKAPIEFSRINNGDKGALLHAIKGGNLAVVKYLLEKGAKVKLRRQRSPLIECINSNSNPEILKCLIKAGANVNLADLHGHTTLGYAAESGNLIYARILIENGATINRKCKISQITPLACAVLKEQFDMAKYLLDAGAHVNATNKWNETPLMMACQTNNLKLVKLLVKYGVYVNYVSRHAQKKFNYSALLYAFEKMNLDIVKFLVEKGAKISVVRKYTRSIYFAAALYTDSEIVKYLKSCGL